MLTQRSYAWGWRVLLTVAAGLAGCGDEGTGKPQLDGSTTAADAAVSAKDALTPIDARAAGQDVAIGGEDARPAGQDGAAPAADAPGPMAAPYKPCAPGTLWGDFPLRVLEDSSTDLQGQVLDGPTRSALGATEESKRVGACRVLKQQHPFCDPACAAGSACTPSGCVREGKPTVNVGTVEISGATMPVTIMPTGSNVYFASPGVVPGAALTLTARGGALPGFSLRGRGVSVVETPTPPLLVQKSRPLAVTWTPAPAAGKAQMVLVLNIARHAGNPGWLECLVEDTGTFQIDATLIDGLLELGVGGFASLSLSRRSVDSTMVGGGCVEFSVYSDFTRDVDVEGYRSCNADKPCPAPMTCDGNTMLCK